VTGSNYSEFKEHNNIYSRPEGQSLLGQGATVFEEAWLLKLVLKKLVCVKLVINLCLSAPPEKAIMPWTGVPGR